MQEVFKYLLNVNPTTGYVAEVSGLNTLAVTAGSGQVSVASGVALVNGTIYVNDASLNVSVSTPASATRIDRIILRWGSVAATVRAVRLAGTEGGAAPSLTQNSTTYEVSLAQISTTTGGTITVTADQRGFLASSALRGATDASTIEWDTTNKYLKVKSGGITGTQLNQTSISYPGQLLLGKTGGASASAVYLSAAAPAYGWNATGAGSNAKIWDMPANNTTLSIRAVNDAENSVSSALVITRSGVTVTSVALTGTAISFTGSTAVTGTFSTSGAATLASASITGAATVGTTLGVTGASTLGSTLAVTGAATLSSTLAVSGTSTLGDIATAGQFASTKTGGSTSSAVLISASGPAIGFVATGGSTDAKRWDIAGNSNTLAIRAISDDNGTVTFPIIVTRSGTTITSVALNGTTIAVTGAMTVSGSLTASGTITGNVTGNLTGTASAIADGAVSTAAKLASNVVTTAKILDANVTNAKQADMTAATIKGRASGAGTGAPTDLTALQALTIVGGAVGGMILAGRQGGSASDWSTSGSTNRTLTAAYMQVGTVDTGGSSSVTVTFPTAFSQPPVVVTGQRFCRRVALHFSSYRDYGDISGKHGG